MKEIFLGSCQLDVVFPQLQDAEGNLGQIGVRSVDNLGQTVKLELKFFNIFFRLSRITLFLLDDSLLNDFSILHFFCVYDHFHQNTQLFGGVFRIYHPSSRVEPFSAGHGEISQVFKF